MYFLGYTELFNSKLHGFNNDSYKYIYGFYITIFTIKSVSEYLSSLSKINLNNEIENYNNVHRDILFHIKMRSKICITEHPTIRNFLKIQNCLYNPNSLQIVEKIELETGESICILKTFWIRCIQRKWKKICLHNKKRLAELIELKNLKKRYSINIHSKFYGLKGMWYSSFSTRKL